jgi:hypothetical protein
VVRLASKRRLGQPKRLLVAAAQIERHQPLCVPKTLSELMT